MKLYHIGVERGDLPKRVLLPGSRGRARRIMESIGGEVLSDERLLVAIGSYKGRDVAVVETGMGPSSASIVIREVIEAVEGEGLLIRPGTCGSLHPKVKVGHLVISRGVVYDDEVSKLVVGPNYPLIPSPDVTHTLMKKAVDQGYKLNNNLHLGITHTKSSLYEFEVPSLSMFPELVKSRLDMLVRLGVLATEMECSVLLALAERYNISGRSVKTGCILLTVSGYVEDHDTIPFNKISDMDLIKVSLSSIISLDI